MQREQSTRDRKTPRRAGRTHIVIVDGTLSKLDEGCQTHAARLYHLLADPGPSADRTVTYHAGVQGEGFDRWRRAALGIGVNDAIRTGYAVLASRYRPGDRIFLFGYSRGAYAVRSLAGLIGRVGLLKAENAAERRVRRAFRYYRNDDFNESTSAFRDAFCHDNVPIDFIGCWDTVKALGLPYPILSRFFPMATEFHDHTLGDEIHAAYHALALDENRTAYCPVTWNRAPGWQGTLEQMWFAGAHGDVGGERSCKDPPLPFTNISLAWMIERAVENGLNVPEGWRDLFPTNVAAPMVGSHSGIARFFILRRPRVPSIGVNGETIHPSVYERMNAVPGYIPRARLDDHVHAEEVLA